MELLNGAELILLVSPLRECMSLQTAKAREEGVLLMKAI